MINDIKIDPSSWDRLTLKPKDLVLGLVSCLKGVSTCSIDKTIEGFFQLSNSFEIKKDPELLIYTLINRSILRTFIVICNENNIEYKNFNNGIFREIDEKIKFLFNSNNYYVNSDFFKHPERLPVLNDIKYLFKNLLLILKSQDESFTKYRLERIISKFNQKFVNELATEWNSNADKYQMILSRINSIFDESLKREQQWNLYRYYLQNLMNETVFNDDISLSDIYVNLRVFTTIYNPEFYNENRKFNFNVNEIIHTVEYCDEYLIKWIENTDKDDAFKVISGGPGYGKSTVLKKITSLLAAKGLNVVFIQMHKLNYDESLKKALDEYFECTPFFDKNPLDKRDFNVVILDGLDELIMQGEALFSKVKKILKEIKIILKNGNSIEKKLVFLLSGRELLIDKCKQFDIYPTEVVDLLPYTKCSDLKLRSSTIFSETILDIDQRKDWWTNYLNYMNIDKSCYKYICHEDFLDITSLPLLNYLLAHSIKSGFEFTSDSNMNDLYEFMIKNVYNCKRNEYTSHKFISCDNFFDILSEIAYCSWLDNSRIINLNNVELHLKYRCKLDIYKQFQSDIENGINSLYIAFYFRHIDKENRLFQTFEFTHKTFMEYLTSVKLVHSMLEIFNLDFNAKVTIQKIVTLFGEKDLDKDLIRFLKFQIYKIDTIRLNKIVTNMLKFIKALSVDCGMNDTFNNSIPVQKLIIAENWILYFHGIANDKCGNKSSLRWRNENQAREFIYKRYGRNILLNSFFIDDISMACSIIEYGEVFNSKLSYVKLTRNQLSNLYFIKSELFKINFDYSKFDGVNFTDCIITESSFKYCEIGKTCIKNSTLKSVTIKDVIGCLEIINCTLKSSLFLNSQIIFKNNYFVGINLKNIPIPSFYGAELNNKFANCILSKEQFDKLVKMKRCQSSDLNNEGFVKEK